MEQEPISIVEGGEDGFQDETERAWAKERVREYIRCNPTAAFTSNELAQTLGLGPGSVTAILNTYFNHVLESDKQHVYRFAKGATEWDLDHPPLDADHMPRMEGLPGQYLPRGHIVFSRRNKTLAEWEQDDGRR